MLASSEASLLKKVRPRLFRMPRAPGGFLLACCSGRGQATPSRYFVGLQPHSSWSSDAECAAQIAPSNWEPRAGSPVDEIPWFRRLALGPGQHCLQSRLSNGLSARPRLATSRTSNGNWSAGPGCALNS